MCASTDEFLVQHFYCRAPVFYVPGQIPESLLKTAAVAPMRLEFADRISPSLSAILVTPVLRIRFTLLLRECNPKKVFSQCAGIRPKNKQLQVMERQEFAEWKSRERVSNSILQMKKVLAVK